MDKLRFCTTNLRCVILANSCTDVVLPQPVSPTSNTGSAMETHTATLSKTRNACLVKANCWPSRVRAAPTVHKTAPRPTETLSTLTSHCGSQLITNAFRSSTGTFHAAPTRCTTCTYWSDVRAAAPKTSTTSFNTFRRCTSVSNPDVWLNVPL